MTGSTAARRFISRRMAAVVAADLAGDPDAERLRVVVAAIALVDVDAPDLDAGVLSTSATTGPSVWPSKGLPCSALACSTNWPPLGLRDGDRDRHLAAELVGRPGLALADALDLRGVQRIDLRPALALILEADPLTAKARSGAKRFGERRVAGDLAADVADQPSQARAQELELAVGALELVGVGIAPDHDRGPLGDPQIALPERDAVALGEADELLDRPVGEPGVGRMGDRLRLHRRVDGDPLEVLRRQRFRLVGDPQTLLQERRKPLLAQPLTPARQRRAVEGERVAEHALAAEILKIGVLHPARAQRLVAERMHVLEDEETGDQPHRQRRLSVSRRIDLAEAPVEETPVDLSRQPHQRMAHVDDRFQRRPEKVGLPIVARFRHLDPPRRIDAGIESKNARMRNPKSPETRPRDRAFLQNRLLRRPGKPQWINELPVLHGRPIRYELRPKSRGLNFVLFFNYPKYSERRHRGESGRALPKGPYIPILFERNSSGSIPRNGAARIRASATRR